MRNCVKVVPVIKAKTTNTAPDGYYPLFKLNTVFELTTLFMALGLAFILACVGNNPFIHFQF